MNSGIYQITNLVNNKIYIGSATNLSQRKSEHLWKLSVNRHENSHLQKSYNFYGEENFIFEILEYVSPNGLLDAEQTYLDLIFDPYFFDQTMRYNILPYAYSGMKGLEHSEETKNKMSKSHNKAVLQINKNTGEVIAEFSSQLEAEKITGIDQALISAVCRKAFNIIKGKKYIYKSAGGFNWSFA